MASETDCINEALGLIGASRISGLDEDSINARHALTFYAPTRDALLRMHHWNFATGRAALSASTTAPLFEFTYAYPLPEECLKVREYNGVPVTYAGQYPSRYTVEGRSILTNDTTVLIVYTARVTDLTRWDALAYQVLMTWLASKLAQAIPKDQKKSAELLQVAMNMLLPSALAADGQEGTVQALISDSLTWGR